MYGSKSSITAVFMVFVTVVGMVLAGCSGSGNTVGVSSSIVSGTAAAGAPLVGQVTLKDASATPGVKTTTIANDGTFAIDVTGLKAPFILEAQGNAGGTSHLLHSFASSDGVANINPLSEVIVASAAGTSDGATAFASSNPQVLNTINNNITAATTTVVSKLQPLLVLFNAQAVNPITDQYTANHQGLDAVFDAATMTVSGGTLTVTNATTSAVIVTGNLNNLANATINTGNMPTPMPVPMAPTSLVATGGTNQVTLSWNPVQGATGYNLYFSTTPGVTTSTGTKLTNVTSPFIHNGLVSGTTYFYVLTAVNSTGESAPSSQASATTTAVITVPQVPAAPVNVMATGGTKQVTISWAPVNGASSYNIYWSTTTGVTTSTGTKITGVTSPAVHNALADSTTYFYIVTAVNSAGESPASAQVSATTLAPAPTPTVPAAPTGVNAVGGTNQVTISWGAVSGATSYNLYWSTTTGVTTSTGTKITGVASPFVHTGLNAGTTYYYIVTAVNSVGESLASAQTSAATALPALDGAALYGQYCGCHGPLASSSKRKRTASQIQSAINGNVGGMGSLSILTPAQVQAIANALNF